MTGGEFIYRTRKLLKLNQTEMGELLEVHQSAVSRMENDLHEVTLTHLKKLAQRVKKRKHVFWRLVDECIFE